MTAALDEITRLAGRCKASVHVTINAHRGFYDRLEDQKDLDVTPEVFAEMLRIDTLVTVQFYPDTPIGSFLVHHHDLAAAVTEAHVILDAEEQKKRCK